ncbi:MAG: ABC transporter substrate-binding protein [Pseudomonadota bacterium]
MRCLLLTPAILPAALILALPATAGADELTPFRFGTNWVAQAEHGGYYQALADGTYADCGLAVEIVPGGPQVNGRALMLGGRLEAYMGGNMLQPFLALAEDIPIIVVGANFQKEPQVLMTHPGRIDSFEDIGAQDLTVLANDPSFQTWYQLFVRKAGFKDENREPYTFNSAPFLADEDKAQQGYVTSEPYAIEREAGWKPDIWLLADYGFESYSTTIEMMKPYVEANAEAVQCFVDATAIGWYNYLYGDNSAANALIQKDNPDMSDGQLAYSLVAMKEFGIVDSGDALELGINAMSEARMRRFYEDMVAVGVIDAGLPIEDAYTLQFVNNGVGLDVKQALTGQ